MNFACLIKFHKCHHTTEHNVKEPMYFLNYYRYFTSAHFCTTCCELSPTLRYTCHLFYCFSTLLNLQKCDFAFQKLTDEDCLLRPQSQFGILYEENGYILFQAQVMELPTVAFLIDVFCRSATFQSENHEPAEVNINVIFFSKNFL